MLAIIGDEKLEKERERERRGMRKKYAEYKKYSEGGGEHII